MNSSTVPTLRVATREKSVNICGSNAMHTAYTSVTQIVKSGSVLTCDDLGVNFRSFDLDEYPTRHVSVVNEDFTEQENRIT